MKYPWEACAGFFSGTEFLGVVWASTEDIAYQLALAEYGEQTDTDGLHCLFVREPLHYKIEEYYKKAGKKLPISKKIEQSRKLKLLKMAQKAGPLPTGVMATKTIPIPIGLAALKRVHQRVQKARQKLQRVHPKACSNMVPMNHKEVSVYSIVEKWLKDEIDLINRRSST